MNSCLYFERLCWQRRVEVASTTHPTALATTHIHVALQLSEGFLKHWHSGYATSLTILFKPNGFKMWLGGHHAQRMLCRISSPRQRYSSSRCFRLACACSDSPRMKALTRLRSDLSDLARCADKQPATIHARHAPVRAQQGLQPTRPSLKHSLKHSPVHPHACVCAYAASHLGSGR